MPEHMRATLRATTKAAAPSDPASALLSTIFAELDEAMRKPAGDLAKAYVLAPLRPLVGESGIIPPSRFRFTTEDLSKIWGWMGRHLAKDMVETAKKCKRPESDPIWFEFRRQAGAALAEAVHKADRVPKDMTALLKRFGGEGRAMLSDAIVLLNNCEEIAGAMAEVPEKIEDFDDDLSLTVKRLHETMHESNAEAALWVLLLTMGRLESPWQIFRVVKRIGRRDDDLVVSKTELAAVGDAVLGDTGYFAARLKQPPQTLEEAKACYLVFDRFVAFSTGMTAEFGIRKDGRWGRSLFGLRAEASTNVEKILAKVPLALDAGLPEPRRGRSGRVIPAQIPPEAAIDKAEGLLYFLGKCREHATAAAIASTQKRIADAAEKRMQEAGEMLVDLVATSEGQNRTTAQDGLDITVRLMLAAGCDEAASLLRRRGVAAAAA
ncbi:hypothetical protein AWH62_10560 [Maricaulis sp. W15]|nr:MULTISPECIES: hypothetical protein [Maricaulis]OLF72270.1 hypothetical protein AWH62_10560 [Maricaulis sp. W15]